MVPYQPGAPVQRPGTALKVLGIIQIVFGILGLLSAPVTVLVAIFNAASKDPVQRKLHTLMWEGPVAAWSYSQAALGFVFAVLLIATGIGVVRGKLWGRTVGLVYAIGTLASLLIGQVIMFVAVYPALFDMLSSTNPIERAGAAGGIGGGVGAAIFGMVLPLITLVVLARKSARDQLT
jgi:hypothetical protein